MHERFRFKNSRELILKARELGFDLPFSDDISPLLQPLTFDGLKTNNRMVVQPMEGYDSDGMGSPSDLTKRRYLRFAEGGSGIIWFEAVSVCREGRSNPHQLWLNKNNADHFARLNDDIRKTAGRLGFDPLLIIQLTHSGRYSKPEGKAEPLAAAPNPVLDRDKPYILTDDDLKRIRDQYVVTSKLAARSGFDAIDLKACHGYLMIDLLAAKGRINSIYGGEEPEKRFRFFLGTFDRMKDEASGSVMTTRLNISDLYPGGFGVDDKGNPDFSEPVMLVDELGSRGVHLINISMGSPYYNAYVTRPFDTPLPGQPVPDEHPVAGVMNMINNTALFQKRFPDIYFTGSAWSYLRHYAPNVGAAVIKNGSAALIGFGRNSFAYPSMTADLIKTGRTDPAKVCIACSGCTRLIRNMRPGGCVIRDRSIYGAELKKLIADGK